MRFGGVLRVGGAEQQRIEHVLHVVRAHPALEARRRRAERRVETVEVVDARTIVALDVQRLRLEASSRLDPPANILTLLTAHQTTMNTLLINLYEVSVLIN